MAHIVGIVPAAFAFGGLAGRDLHRQCLTQRQSHFGGDEDKFDVGAQAAQKRVICRWRLQMDIRLQ